MSRYVLCLLATTATAVLAVTDLSGCTSFTSTVTPTNSRGPGYGAKPTAYETVIWYRPGTLEICQGVDCGGGRSRGVPGCPRYTGTETVERKFLQTDPAAPPPTTTTTVVTTAPKKTSTVDRFVTTGSRNSTATVTATRSRVSSLTLPIVGSTTASANATSTETGTSTTEDAQVTGPVSTTNVPAGAGPTARAGIAAALGVAAAVVLV